MGKYIHYGSDHFDPLLFKPIYNDIGINKPRGGFWASPVAANRGWLDWCVTEDFRIETLSTHFEFNIRADAKILYIRNKAEMDSTLKYKTDFGITGLRMTYLDWERIAADGYQAIVFEMNNDTHWDYNLWDVDTLVVIDPDIIIPDEI